MGILPKKKQKRNKSIKNKIKENYIITQNNNDSNNLSKFNKLSKYRYHPLAIF